MKIKECIIVMINKYYGFKHFYQLSNVPKFDNFYMKFSSFNDESYEALYKVSFKKF